MKRLYSTRPRWDTSAHNMAPVEAARARLVLAQQRQQWAFEMMSGVVRRSAHIDKEPSDIQREACDGREYWRVAA